MLDSRLTPAPAPPRLRPELTLAKPKSPRATGAAPRRRGAGARRAGGAAGADGARAEPGDDGAEGEGEGDREGDREGDGDEREGPEGELDGFDEAGAEPAPEAELDDTSAPVSVEPPRSALARVDALQVYMREVQRHPLLSAAEEHELAVHYAKTQDVDAAARLVTANLRLVVKLAYEYRRAYRNIMDLVQEGNIGLMQAVKRYDPYRGVKLSSYAAWWIRAYMLRFILNNWRLVKIGTTQAQRKLFFNLSKEKARLSAMGIEPTSQEIAKRLGVEEKDVIEMDRRLARADASLDATVGDSEERGPARVDLMASDDAGPDQLTEGAQLGELVRARLDEFRQRLAGKDAIIFDKRLVAEDPLTLQELGQEFGVSRERVRQLEARLTGKLRDFLRETLGDAVEVRR
ncbi:MAG: RNA polymerase factor sigma-32 [Polyangiaceae bacterium]|nr:RNA polymerase factor sigma-32 [Polyangiaceae bacterium]